MNDERTYTAFVGEKLVVTAAPLPTLLTRSRERAARTPDQHILVFEDWSGRQIEFDLRGTLDEVLARAEPEEAKRGPGRPKLGVVAREVTLLPRHWEWLEEQPQGASAALRRLVDEARKRSPGKERARRIREAASKVMWAMAGDLPNFEEASRALFAGNDEQFESLVRKWPKAIRDYLVGRIREATQRGANPTGESTHEPG